MTTLRSSNGSRKPRGPAKATKAQIAARDRLLRDAERRTGVKITQAQIDAIAAELGETLTG